MDIWPPTHLCVYNYILKRLQFPQFFWPPSHLRRNETLKGKCIVKMPQRHDRSTDRCEGWNNYVDFLDKFEDWYFWRDKSLKLEISFFSHARNRSKWCNHIHFLQWQSHRWVFRSVGADFRFFSLILIWKAELAMGSFKNHVDDWKWVGGPKLSMFK